MSVSEMRYYEVQTRLDARNVRKIIDLGCSEGLFLQRLSRSETYTRLVGVDIDNELLEATTRWNVMPEALQNDIKYRRT
jgi:predicted TPR repeat methyltransferase